MSDWIRRKAKFKLNTTGENMTGFMTVDAKDAQTAYMPMSGYFCESAVRRGRV